MEILKPIRQAQSPEYIEGQVQNDGLLSNPERLPKLSLTISSHTTILPLIIIESSPLRDQLSSILSQEHLKAVKNATGNTLEAFDEIGKIPGITIIKRFDPRKTPNFDCRDYVFGQIMNEGWYKPYDYKLEEEMLANTICFLRFKGYYPVETPRPGDIVAYMSYLQGFSEQTEASHWGIYGKTGVISKFGKGHIFQHDVSVIPGIYGKEALFFRPVLLKRMKRQLLSKISKSSQIVSF